MNPLENPYQPPLADPKPEPIADRASVKKQVARPATALIVTSSIHSVLVCIQLCNVYTDYLGTTAAANAVPVLLMGLIQLAVLLTISIGAAQMADLRRYYLAYLAAFLACIPLLSPFIVVGIPFGIWSLVLLGRPEIKAAFQD